MSYQKQIEEAFSKFGFTPRDNQVNHVSRICEAFLEEEAKNVVLSAPTGTGKSIIGTVAAEVIHSIKNPATRENASFLLSATNVLLDQYHQTFAEKAGDNTFLLLKGAANYECSALSTDDEPQTAENCAITLFRKNGMQNFIDTYCNSCEYAKARALKATSRHLITNYAFYFIDRMYAQAPLPRRTVAVFDEAHLLNDLFTDHNAIYISEKRLAQCADEVNDNLSLGNTDIFRDLKVMRDALIKGQITEQNYSTWLKQLLEVYNLISETAKSNADRNIRNASKYLKLQKLAKKYYNFGCKIDDLFTFQYPHVFEYKKKDPSARQSENEIHVKPIFIGDMFEVLDNAEHNLLMSATISEQFAKRTMTLPGKTKHIRLDPQFLPENKKVIFYKPQSLNYRSMQETETVTKLSRTVTEIVKHHTEKEERGIILTPSFVVTETVCASLRKEKGNFKIFEHVRGEKLATILADFKQHSKGPAVLVTPSGFEGIDLPGDLSRFQVLVKMPYASLGDKRIQTILDNFPDIYQLQALMKVVQGAGRSVRSQEDWATTYILDSAVQRVWTAKTNEWSNEFQTLFKSSLKEMTL